MAKKKIKVEKTKVEEQLVEQPKEEVAVEQPKEEVKKVVDETEQLLLDFAEWWRALPNKKMLSRQQAVELWQWWQKVAKRTDRFHNCTSCIIANKQYLHKLCSKYNIVL